MKLLAIGDIVGRGGREGLLRHLSGILSTVKPDLTIVNAENAAGGFGLTPGIADELFEAGVDVITLGNHAWDQRAMLQHIVTEPRIIRAMNFPAGAPGLGANVFKTKAGARVLVTQVMGRVFLDPMDDPFGCMDSLFEKNRLKQEVDAVVVDFHAEATSEKMALGHYLDGRATLVFGTHTHVPTADAQVLPGGTAYQTDLGMTGDYDSVIGMKKETSIARFTRKLPTERMAPAARDATVCGVVVTVDEATGLAADVQPLRVGGRLIQTMS